MRLVNKNKQSNYILIFEFGRMVLKKEVAKIATILS